MILIITRNWRFWSFFFFIVWLSCFQVSFFVCFFLWFVSVKKIQVHSKKKKKKQLATSFKILHYSYQNTDQVLGTPRRYEFGFHWRACFQHYFDPVWTVGREYRSCHLMVLPVASWGFKLSRYRSMSFKMRVTFV